MNILTNYFYKGTFAQDLTSTAVTVNAVNYWTLVAEVAIFYGQYQGADQPLAIQPINMPPITNVEFTADFYRVGGSKYAPARLINVVPIYEVDNMRNCLGTKFTFVSPIVAPDDCVYDYQLVWSTSGIEMSYGPNLINIAAQSGTTNPESLC